MRSTTNWACVAGAAALITSTAPGLSQESWFAGEIVGLPAMPAGREPDMTPPKGEAMGPARDFRVLWADPAIRNFTGTSENDWDFNNPDGIPGFGSLPYPGGSR